MHVNVAQRRVITSMQFNGQLDAVTSGLLCAEADQFACVKAHEMVLWDVHTVVERVGSVAETHGW